MTEHIAVALWLVAFGLWVALMVELALLIRNSRRFSRELKKWKEQQ